jgi:ribonuclease VapC
MALGEAEGEACARLLEREDEALISAASLAESMIVAMGRGVEAAFEQVLQGAELSVVEADHATAVRISQVYRRWGKGFHPARLNFGDCFAYELATRRDCPLLFVGEDFAKTDVRSAL